MRLCPQPSTLAIGLILLSSLVVRIWFDPVTRGDSAFYLTVSKNVAERGCYSAEPKIAGTCEPTYNRPLASGELTPQHALAMVPTLLLLSVGVAVVVGRWEFLAVILVYYCVTIAYSLFLKRRIAIDICVLAGLYTLRLIAGGVATGIELSVWLFAFSMFFFLSLAAVKRQAELVDNAASGQEQVAGRAYLVADLPIVSTIAIASGYVSVLIVALYIDSEAVRLLYNEPRLLLGVCPVLLYWITRIASLAQRGCLDDDPIMFALRDSTSYLCAILILGAVVGATVF